MSRNKCDRTNSFPCIHLIILFILIRVNSKILDLGICLGCDDSDYLIILSESLFVEQTITEVSSHVSFLDFAITLVGSLTIEIAAI